MKDDTTRDGSAEQLGEVPSHRVPEAPEADQDELADVPYAEIATAPEDDQLQSHAGEFAEDANETAAPAAPVDPASVVPGPPHIPAPVSEDQGNVEMGIGEPLPAYVGVDPVDDAAETEEL